MTKPRCILHIGMPKTGTSSIQETLSKTTIVENCEYLDIGELGNHSTIIYSLFAKRPELHHVHIALQRTKFQVDEFVQYHKKKLEEILSSTDSAQYVISGEDILFLEEDELYDLYLFLTKFSSEIHVIAYVRPPISFMQSAFQQKIKEGDLRFGLAGFYPKYRNRFERFDRVFGRKNVSLIKFDSDSLLEGNVVLDFCNRIGISINNKAVLRVNESLSLEAIALLYVFYKFNKDVGYVASYQHHMRAQSLLTFGVQKFHYSKSLSDQIRTQIACDIEWMENRMEGSLAESIPDSDNGISSEEELVEIAFTNKVKMLELMPKGVISAELWQRMLTPQGKAKLFGRITYSVDMYHEGFFRGWILNNNNPLQRILIEIRQEQRVIAYGIANQFRQDLADAAIGDGNCAFVIKAVSNWEIDNGKLFLRAVDFDQEFEIDASRIRIISV